MFNSNYLINIIEMLPSHILYTIISDENLTFHFELAKIPLKERLMSINSQYMRLFLTLVLPAQSLGPVTNFL